MKQKLELLAPAGNAETGIAAVNCGADAVYIGAPKFGARAAAGNSLADIERLIAHAHKFNSKVYITVNTLIYDKELKDAEKLINNVYNAGADAIIIQDMGILGMNIPPIPLFASTQTHNTTPGKVKFLEQAGFSRVILARELSLAQIKDIKKSTGIELEFFIHGALCVCYSGQCYFSLAQNGRSANRGECAQPCRMMYDLADSEGKILAKDKYLLSLKDLNLSLYLNDLIEAGISSFKIEGRLKDINYVKNVTAYYRQRIDYLLEEKPGYAKSSSGKITYFFTPELERSFNRGFTDYFLNRKNKSISSFNTPKSVGKQLGKAVAVRKDFLEIESDEKIVNGDGLCFFDAKGELSGFNVNRVEGKRVYPHEMKFIKPGTVIYRNSDHDFEKLLSGRYAERKIEAAVAMNEEEGRIKITVRDEEGCEIEFDWDAERQEAKNGGAAIENIRKQLSKTGDSIYRFGSIDINLPRPYFFAVSKINELRRIIIDKLDAERKRNYKREIRKEAGSIEGLQAGRFDYRLNVVNKLAAELYKKAGAEDFEKGAELQDNFENKVLMTCKYCIKNELGICPIETGKSAGYKEPLYLIDKNKEYRLQFDCGKCEMSVLY